MSWTETHFGKFKILATGRENINKYIREHNLEVDDPEDDDLYPIDKKYCITYPYRKGNQHLIEFIEHEEFEDGEGFAKFAKNKDGTISFVVQFYNGGCFLGEALGDFESNLDVSGKDN